MDLQLMTDFIGKPRQRLVIEVIGQNHAFVPPIGLNIGRLPAQIDVVFGVDFELFGDLGLKFARIPARSATDRETAMSG